MNELPRYMLFPRFSKIDAWKEAWINNALNLPAVFLLPLFPLFNSKKEKNGVKNAEEKEYAREGGRVECLFAPPRANTRRHGCMGRMG